MATCIRPSATGLRAKPKRGFAALVSILGAALVLAAGQGEAAAAFSTTYQAEDSSLDWPMAVGSDPDAMGEAFISPTSGGQSRTPVAEATLAFVVPESDTYYVWARIHGPNGGSDALYVGVDSTWDRVFPSTHGAYEWVRVGNGSRSFGFALGAGGHIFQVGRGETNARIDALHLTTDADAEPPFEAPEPPPALYSSLFEAEDGTLSSPMAVGHESAALGGAYLSPTSGGDSTTPLPEATLDFSVPRSSVYYLWARLEGPDGSSDALYVGIDGSWDRVFPSSHGAYEWIPVANGAGSTGFSLGAGDHRFQIGRGEVGARIDALYVTEDAFDVPTHAPDVSVAAPTASIGADPTAIEHGESSTITWWSSDADACEASGDWSGTKSTSGSLAVAPDADATYALTCSGAGGSASTSVSIAVAAPPPPIVSLSASPSAIDEGQSSTLTWSSTDADSCQASGDWSGAKATSGSASASPTADATYSLVCSGAGGDASATVVLSVTPAPAPTVDLSAEPSSIESGESATLAWSSSDASSCEASGDWSGAKTTSGSAEVSPTSDAIYMLTCTGLGGSTGASVSVAVTAPPPPPSGGDDLPRGGWGSDVVAGDDRPVCTVTNRNDSGSGSLRSCLAGGDVLVQFAVEGTIQCSSTLDVEAYTTIDGTTAPGGGITVQGCMVRMAGSGAHDIRLKGFRIRSSSGDNLQIQEGAHDIHVTQMSLAYCGDGNVDVTRGAHHVTLDHSILAGCGKNMLIADTVESHGDLHSIAVHRNVFVDSQWRNPWVSAEREGGTGPGTTVHFEGNVVWGWEDSGGGIGSECGSVLNVEKNLFKCNDAGNCSTSRQRNHVIVKSRSTCDDPRVYSSGNRSADPSGNDPDQRGNVSGENPRPVPDVPPVTDWCTAAHEAVSRAGARPLDGVDQDHLATITLPSCS